MGDISRNIRDLRKSRGWTQEQLAEALFVTRQTVSNYENGRSRPDLDMVTRIAEILETDVDVLLNGLPDREERRQKLRRLAICIGVCLALLVLSRGFHHLTDPLLHKYYMAAPFLLLNMTLDQWLFLMLGWTLMFAVLLLWNRAPSLTQKVRQWGRRVLIGLLILWVLLLLPTILSLTAVWTSYAAEGTIRDPFHWPQAYTRLISNVIMPLLTRAYWVNIPFGAMLCLFGIPPLQSHREKTDPSA